MDQEKLKTELGKVISSSVLLHDLVSTFSEIAADNSVNDPIEETISVISQLYPKEFKDLKQKDLKTLKQILKENLKVEESQKPKEESPVAENAKPPEISKKPTKTKVYLSPKISSYGGRFYDFGSETWIKGTESQPQEVELTIFIQRKIVTGELIEIRE